jgi:glycosyltransferase involved in cell wall biosynthesis
MAKERVIWKRMGKPLRAGLLLDEPPVLYIKFNDVSWRWQIKALGEKFNQPGLLLVGFLWLQNDRTARWMHEVKALCAKHLPGWEMIILCNSDIGKALYKGTDLRAELFSQNSLLDERVYKIEPDVAKEFNAIYDGQLIRFKRHHLAYQVESLALISYKYDMNYDPSYGRKVVSDLSKATWINNPIDPNYRKLSDAEVAREYNRARVGLCLSAEEGSMYASTQYLLCGLPIVTTKSRGGRDLMFNPKDCIYVEDTAESVALGVKEAISRNLNPAEVRARVLEKMTQHRARLIEIVQEYLDKRSSNVKFAEVFHRHFANKLLAVKPMEELKMFPARDWPF